MEGSQLTRSTSCRPLKLGSNRVLNTSNINRRSANRTIRAKLRGQGEGCSSSPGIRGISSAPNAGSRTINDSQGKADPAIASVASPESIQRPQSLTKLTGLIL